MRDPNRLDDFYTDMKVLHKKLPDLRFMQLMNLFFDWHAKRYNSDGFYVEDNRFIDRFREFVETMKEGN